METHFDPSHAKESAADRQLKSWRASQEILVAASHTDDVARFLSHSLPLVMSVCHADSVAVASLTGASRDGENWTNLGQVGRVETLSRSILAAALDAESPIVFDGWLVAPLDCRGAHPELLAMHARVLAQTELQTMVEIVLPSLREGMSALRDRRRREVRIERLEAILEIVGRWNQTQEVEDLLVQMAEAATRLVEADRASIFLWDRAAHQLVGRPALGVGSNDLRIADNAGVVGQVIATGQPQRLDLSDDPTAVNRQVDSSLGYQTRTLLCVPLRGRDGDLFGAFEVINKRLGDFNDDDELALVELATHAGIALENTQERESLLESRRQITDEAAAGVQLVGQSAVMEALRSTIRRVAPTELAVLLLGENGTGKEVVSQSIHYQSPRRHHPFVAVNCAALTETLLENELFGHEKGAYTDAGETRPGKFELASGGTLFLDEIGDLSLAGQAKLLRVLEEKIVVHVGGLKNIHTDVRVIAATNQDLADLVRHKKFREDLYFRLNVVTLVLPPLRERPADIIPLAEYFLREFSRHAHRKIPRLAASARHRLETHPWPGNVRELRNLCERVAYLHATDKVEAEDLAFVLSPTTERPALIATDLPLAEATDRFQVEHIQQTVRRAAGNMSEAAEMLGLHRSNLYRKMRQLGMPLE
ncbi:MAG TPA: sigma-54-dependent Fis family transcriptional regulator [Pirellulales bacterium]|jgi:Nif-specific regulatory protein